MRRRKGGRARLSRLAWISAALLCMVMVPVAAAGGDKLFDDLDAIIKEESKKEAPTELVPGGSNSSIFRQLFLHSHVELTARYAHYAKDIPYTEEDTGELSLAFNTWTGKEHWRLHASGWLEAGTQDETYKGVSDFLRDESRRRRYLELNEIYTTISGGNLDVTLGRRVMPKDTTLWYQPSYVYHPLDLNVPVEPRTFGLWQLAADYALGDSQLTAAVLPVFQDPKVPAINSRWMPFYNEVAKAWSREEAVWLREKFLKGPVDDDPKSVFLYYYWRALRYEAELRRLLDNKSVEVKNDLPGGSLDEFGYLAKIKTSAGLVDLYGSYFFGPSEFPVVKIEERADTVAFLKKNPSVHKTGAGAGTTWRDFIFHVDGVFTLSPEDEDDSFIRYLGGVGYTAPWLAAALRMDRVDVLVDYARETITERQDAPGYFFSSEIIRPFRRDILVRVLLGITGDLSARYLADYDLRHDAKYHHVGMSYRLWSGLVSEVYFEWFDGGLNSYFGTWRDNDRVVVLLRWTL